ncbi:SCP2 sterol-binding domain-containing protein [Psychromonas sp. MME2]|uniref:ubiquinone biosynthesis accessory factor UbiJ n=1 Tax=unclassified Psychromonas TaxID=2614957 RepID=UPI00339CC05E
MPLDNLFCGLLETAVNKIHQLDACAEQRRKQLDGTIFSVLIKELNKPLYFVISAQQIDILSQFEGTIDCSINVNISALPELQNNLQLTHLIKTEQLEVQGDIKLVQQFAQLLTEMNIDWEEFLSTKVGDVLAHKICYHLKSAKQDINQQLIKLQSHGAQIVTEELKIAPGPLQVAYFCDQVSDVEKQCAQLEARLKRCTEKFNGTVND